METERCKRIVIGMTGPLHGDQRMIRIADALSEPGHRVHIIHRRRSKFGYPGEIDIGGHAFTVSSIHVPFSSGLLFYVSFNLMLFFRLIFRKCDLLYAVDSDTLPAMTGVRLIRTVPLAYDAHEFFPEVPELSGRPMKKMIWDLVTRAGINLSAVRITVGTALARILEIRYGKPFQVIRNVPELTPVASEPIFTDPVILYQGALNKGRMLELLIEAIKKMPGFFCIIAGEGDLSTELRKQASGCDRIRFTGHLSPDELRKLSPRCFAGYNLLDAGDSISYRYSLSNKYFDYMHAGIPSISSALPEYMELNEKYGCGICIPDDLPSLTGILNQWKNDPVLYARLKENAKFAASCNHWNAEKEKLKSLFTA